MKLFASRVKEEEMESESDIPEFSDLEEWPRLRRTIEVSATVRQTMLRNNITN
jgi:hypothetical protein